MSKSLTIRYSIQRVLYDSSNCAFVAYAATSLLSRGYRASEVGIILFSAMILSFIFQPVAASVADKSKKNLLPYIMFVQAAICALCFSTAILINPPHLLFGLLYMVGLMVLDMNIPMFNALSVYYSGAGYGISYETSRACGAAGYGIASLAFGKIMATRGSDSVILLAIVLTVMLAVIALSYPKVNFKSELQANAKSSLSVFTFIKKHPWFTVSLLGIVFLGLVHVMIENYLIEIVSRIGGDSTSVGIALCCATLIEAVFISFYAKIQKRLGSRKVFIIAGTGYMLKAIIFVLAKSLLAVYAAQLLQAITYTFLAPVQMYYAEECTDKADMVKGQAFATASYTLGCAFGNLLGGLLITSFGITFMLESAVFFATLGTLILIITVPKAMKR